MENKTITMTAQERMNAANAVTMLKDNKKLISGQAAEESARLVNSSTMGELEEAYRLRSRRFALNPRFVGVWETMRVIEDVSWARRNSTDPKVDKTQKDTFLVEIRHTETRASMRMPAYMFLNSYAWSQDANINDLLVDKAGKFDAMYRDLIPAQYAQSDLFFLKENGDTIDYALQFVHERLGYVKGSKANLILPEFFAIKGAMVMEESFYPYDVDKTDMSLESRKKMHPFISKTRYNKWEALAEALKEVHKNPTKKDVYDAIKGGEYEAVNRIIPADSPELFDVNKLFYHNPRNWFYNLIMDFNL